MDAPFKTEEIEGLGIHFDEVIAVLFRRRKLIGATVFLIVALATIAAYVVPPVYEAKAVLLVARNAPDLEDTEDRRQMALERGELLATEAEILKSPTMALRCLEENKRFNPAREEVDYIKVVTKYLFLPIKKLGLVYESTDPVYARVRAILGNITVTESVDANTLEIVFVHDNPKKASQAINLLIDTYLRARIEMLSEPALESHFQKQVDDTGRRLDEVEDRVLDLAVETGLVDPEIELASAVHHLAGMRNEVTDLGVQRLSLVARLEEIDRLISEKPAEALVRKEMSRNPAWSHLDEEITSVERRLALLRRTYRADTEPIAAANTELEALREVQGKTKSMITTAETYAPNPASVALQRERDATLVDYATMTKRLDVLGRVIDQTHRELRTLNQEAAELARADAELLAVSHTYSVYLEQREAAQLADHADPGQVNVKVLQYARIPDKPATPRLVPVVLSFIVGSVLSIGLVTGLELVDGTVRTGRDVHRVAGVPVLAELSETRS